MFFPSYKAYMAALIFVSLGLCPVCTARPQMCG